ncbi:suppressor of loss of ypt1 [Mortierella sp. AD094]|nr:suppressor of loss of ypt1 [Mortierella sp. AD094]
MASAATVSTVHTHFQSSKSSPSQPRLQSSQEALGDRNQTGTSDHTAQLSVHVQQQLPTPRTSISSGASSPPENLSPSTASHSHTYSQSSINTRQAHHNLHQQTHPTNAHSGPQSTIASSNPNNSYNNSGSNGHAADIGLATYTRSPLNQQSQPTPSYRSSSPGPSSKPGAALYGPSSSSSPLAGPSTTASNLYNAGGGGASSMTTATSQTSGTFGGRSHAHAHQQHHQHQQELLLEDEKELQKKNSGPALPGGSGISAFLPPALNQSLIKAVQSAKDVVNSPSSPHSKMSLPRLPTVAEVGGSGGRSNSAFAPKSAWRSKLNMNYIIQALKLPMICLAWYLSSAVTNNIGKQIMNQFRYPVTLTFVQFWFVSVFCFVAGAGFNMARIRRPTKAIIEMTGPLVGFQVVGHVFSSVAISRVPLSVVHTVKALTPLFTVLFYRVVLGTTYSRAVYLSLVPLTAGVMLACRMSLEFNNLVGLSCALLSTLVFVMQNVFTKKILSSSKGKSQDEVGMNGLGNKESISGSDPVDQALGGSGSNPPQKLDKINILFYSSTLAAVCMIPMWFYAEGSTLIFSEDPLGKSSGSAGTWSVISWLLFLNGVSHFFQNFLAFSVLALTSPVTYSIASLIKRIIVIVASIIYFHQTLGITQWTGVCLTFWGLWMYNSAKNAAKVNPASGILANTKVGRRMSRGFGRGLLDSELESGSNRNSKAGFFV